MESYKSGAERFSLRTAIAIITITVVAEREHKEGRKKTRSTHNILADGVDCRWGKDSKDH